ncbi:hypothetical protein [Primorskyibacter sp. S187A]|uniref:hypothetical protein n=1 Tax=Primorskyibacter sp. S187A TaxID=3415130 RepID=UPI003C7A384E
MKKLFDVQLPFFVPLWRRIALVVACLVWAGLEYAWGNPGWALLFLGIGTWCAHQFFIAFDPPDPGEGT